MRESLRALGEVVGGEAAAQVSKRLGMTCSADTVLRLVRHAALPASLPVEVLGVDEWAWRKGQSYGAMLVDLERHAPVDVLEDTSVDSFAARLKRHTSVKLITRDRAGTYADGCGFRTGFAGFSRKFCSDDEHKDPLTHARHSREVLQ